MAGNVSDEDRMAMFRGAMRRLAGGVALVTSNLDERPFGMTMTAVMSLSMDPPSLVVGINQSASIASVLTPGKPFCVNLLRYPQEGFCRQFSALAAEERFSVGEWRRTESGVPWLADAQAAIFCTVGPMHDFGSHRLVVGIVNETILADPVDPLVHVDGSYRPVIR